MTTYIHGSTDEREVARLEKQAHFAWPFVRRYFRAEPNERVLDLATGVGAMAGRILEDFPRVRLFGVDLKLSQLRSAVKNHPQAHYVNADGTALPFADGAFDRIHCSWLLEHVPQPVAILRECRRVLRPGGTAHFIEVDNATFGTTPEIEDIRWAMQSLNEAQLAGGGDPFVGQKLGRYFDAAGFSKIELHRAEVGAGEEDPAHFRASVEEFAEIFEGLDEALGPDHTERLHRAASKLRALPGQRGARMHYAGVIAVATT